MVSPRSFHRSGTLSPFKRDVRSYGTCSLMAAIQASEEAGPSPNLCLSDFPGSQLFFFAILVEGGVAGRPDKPVAPGGINRFGVCGRLLLPPRLWGLLFLLPGPVSGPLRLLLGGRNVPDSERRGGGGRGGRPSLRSSCEDEVRRCLCSL